MKVSGAWLNDEGAQSLLRALVASGHRGLFVGGCVRNAILGVPVGDIDIATDALPETVIKIAKEAGFRAIPTGIDHGTVTVIACGILHEVTTLRRDVQTDGRHAIVAFSGDIAEDAARRDFTMNALYAQADGTVLDPLSGLPDLMARRVRFVGDANARIVEDHLRILRFFRFHAIYGDPAYGIDADGLAACADNLAGLDTLSRDRVGAEMIKLMAGFDPAPALSEFPVELLQVDVVCPNESEAALITGLPVGNVAEAHLAAQRLCALGARNAIITLGTNGCVMCDETGMLQHVPAFTVSTVDSTAAGDAFAGALGFSLAQRKSLRDSVRFASAAGALASTRHGAQPAMPRFDAVNGLAELA